ncbi:hypothetical protein G6F56_003229 [Rhizopus delemar]|nr:hypothetical protein G6F56_003229 [Rhizopus delemar]
MGVQHNNIEVSALQMNESKTSRKRSFGDSLGNFDFATGAKRALTEQDHDKAKHLAAGIGCAPVSLHLSHESTKGELRATDLFDSKSVKLLVDNVPFSNEVNCSLPLDAIVQLHQEKMTIEPTRKQLDNNQNNIGVLKEIRASCLPGIFDLDNYVQADEELIRLLNFDYCLAPKLLHAVAQLHTGSIVSIGDELMLLLATEGYARSKGTDARAEASIKSLPPDSLSLFVGVCEEADGSGSKDKLKIGGIGMNILSTMSVIVGNKMTVNIGPETRLTNPGKGTIFYQAKAVQHFKNCMKEKKKYVVEPNSYGIRQVVSGFNDPLTYKPYRASWKSLANNDILLPATIFKFCDLPHTDYGASNSPAAKIGSRFMKLLAVASLLEEHTLSKSESSNQWKELNKFVKYLESEFEGKEKVDILSLGKKNIGNFADMINQSLSTANARIKLNVKKKLASELAVRRDVQ